MARRLAALRLKARYWPGEGINESGTAMNHRLLWLYYAMRGDFSWQLCYNNKEERLCLKIYATQ